MPRHSKVLCVAGFDPPSCHRVQIQWRIVRMYVAPGGLVYHTECSGNVPRDIGTAMVGTSKNADALPFYSLVNSIKIFCHYIKYTYNRFTVLLEHYIKMNGTLINDSIFQTFMDLDYILLLALLKIIINFLVLKGFPRGWIMEIPPFLLSPFIPGSHTLFRSPPEKKQKQYLLIIYVFLN